MIDIEKLKINLRRTYRERLVSLGMAKHVVDKLEPFLPPRWECKVDEFCWLYISKHEENVHASEFRTVCNLVEKITGEKVIRKAVSQNRLIGSCGIWDFRHYRYRRLYIEIILSNVDGCVIEEKQRLMTFYEASPECLGLQAEEAR